MPRVDTLPFAEAFVAQLHFPTPRTDEGKKIVAKAINERVHKLAETVVAQAKSLIQQSKATTSLSNALPICLNSSASKATMLLISQVFEHAYNLIPTITQSLHSTGGSMRMASCSHEDALIGSYVPSAYGSSRPYLLNVVWSKDCNAIYGPKDLEISLEGSAKTHLHRQWALAQKQIGTDITFVGGDQVTQFHAHKCILAAHSEMFLNQLFGKFAEGEKKISELNISPEYASSFPHLLQFIYTSEVEAKPALDFEQLISLYKCATYYQVESAKAWCANAMSKLMNEPEFKGDVEALLEIGLQGHSESLIAKCFIELSKSKDKEKLNDCLVEAVTKDNWAFIYEVAEKNECEKAVEVLKQMQRFNKEMRHLKAPTSQVSAPTLSLDMGPQGGGGGGGGAPI